MSFFERNSAIIATFLIGVAVLIVLHLYGNGGNTSDASYTLRENFCAPQILGVGLYMPGNSGQPENLTEAQVTDRCKDICTSLGTGCRWFNYDPGPDDSIGGCMFFADNITAACVSDQQPSTQGVGKKTYVKN
jgi:hypothetical protein